MAVVGPGKMTRQIKCLLHKLEDTAVSVDDPSTSSVRRAETGELPEAHRPADLVHTTANSKRSVSNMVEGKD